MGQLILDVIVRPFFAIWITLAVNYEKGGFQLEFVSISQVINHMASYNSSALIDKINNIARHNLIDTKYHQMVFRSARWHCSCGLFGNP